MMRMGVLVSGVGGIAFGLLTVVDLFVANPPGGTYNAANVAAFVAPGSRKRIVVVLFLGVLGVFGLISLLAHLRAAIENAGGDERIPQIFWGTGVAAAMAVGQVFNEGHAMVAGNVSLAAPVIYLAVDLGQRWFSSAASCAIALIILAPSRPSTLASWLRWSTFALGVIGLASLIFIPFFALLLWGIVTGAWVLALRRGDEGSESAVGSLRRFDVISHRSAQEAIGPLLGELARAGKDHWNLGVANGEPTQHVRQPGTAAGLSSK